MLTSFPHKTSAGFLTTYFVTISKWYVDSVPEKTERFATVFGGSIEHLPKGYTRANRLEKLPCPSCRYSQMHNLFIIHVRKRQDLLRKYWTTLNVYYHPPSQWPRDTWFYLLSCEGSTEMSHRALKKSHRKREHNARRGLWSVVLMIFTGDGWTWQGRWRGLSRVDWLRREWINHRASSTCPLGSSVSQAFSTGL